MIQDAIRSLKPIRLATPKSSAALGLISLIVLLTSSLKGQELLCELSAQHAEEKVHVQRKALGNSKTNHWWSSSPWKNTDHFGISIHLSMPKFHQFRSAIGTLSLPWILWALLYSAWKVEGFLHPKNWSQLWLQAAMHLAFKNANGEIHQGNSRNFKCHHPKSSIKDLVATACPMACRSNCARCPGGSGSAAWKQLKPYMFEWFWVDDDPLLWFFLSESHPGTPCWCFSWCLVYQHHVGTCSLMVLLLDTTDHFEGRWMTRGGHCELCFCVFLAFQWW